METVWRSSNRWWPRCNVWMDRDNPIYTCALPYLLVWDIPRGAEQDDQLFFFSKKTSYYSTLPKSNAKSFFLFLKLVILRYSSQDNLEQKGQVRKDTSVLRTPHTWSRTGCIWGGGLPGSCLGAPTTDAALAGRIHRHLMYAGDKHSLPQMNPSCSTCYLEVTIRCGTFHPIPRPDTLETGEDCPYWTSVWGGGLCLDFLSLKWHFGQTLKVQPFFLELRGPIPKM